MWTELVVAASGFKFVGFICIVNYLLSCETYNKNGFQIADCNTIWLPNVKHSYELYSTCTLLYICTMYKLNGVLCYSILCCSMEIKLQSNVEYCAIIAQYNKV